VGLLFSTEVKKMRKVYLILMLTFSAFSLAQENGKISGRVIDARTKEPLSGVNVVLIGRGTGSASDEEGKFFIDGLSGMSRKLKPTSLLKMSNRFI
jgi:hypothetical protein